MFLMTFTTSNLGNNVNLAFKDHGLNATQWLLKEGAKYEIDSI